MLTVAQAEPERIAAARQQLRELLHDWADEDQVDSAVLMVSEMVTNVLVHTDGDALLVAEVTGEPGERRLRVEVTDASDDLPHKRRPGELASVRARPDADGDARGRVGRGPAGRGQVASGSSCTSQRADVGAASGRRHGAGLPRRVALRSSPITPKAAAVTRHREQHPEDARHGGARA